MIKNILVIGGGEYQLEGIKKLKNKGYSIVLVDANESCIGKKYAAVFFCVDITKPELIISFLEKKNISIISAICFSIEIALRSVAYINNYYSLSGLTPEMARIATNKTEQRNIIKSANLPCPEFYEIKKNDDIDAICARIKKYPVIIKPTDNAGTRGVVICRNKEELAQNIEYSFSFSKFDSKVIIEEFIMGIEFTVEALIVNSEILFLGIGEKIKPLNVYTISSEIFYNSPKALDLKNQIEETVLIFLKSAKFNNTITHTEVIYSYVNQQIYIVESSVRGGGFHIFDKVLPYITNTDIIDNTINSLLEISFNTSKLCIEQKPCILGFFCENPGKINSIKIQEKNFPANTSFEYSIFKKEGESVHDLTTDSDRIGYYIVYGKTWNDVLSDANQLRYSIQFEIV